MDELIVPSRFCGPPGSGNGGWTAGALAGVASGQVGPWPAVEVTLRRPPPLDRPLSVAQRDGATVVAEGPDVVGEARLVDTEIEPVEPVAASVAAEAESSYAGHSFHPFPTCFACGTGREDGLRIFPGVVSTAPPRVAATWTPGPDTVCDFHHLPDEHPRSSLAVTWSALDCVGAWAGDFEERLLVLGRMTAIIDSLPVIGEQHVVVGEGRGNEGRKTYAASTLYDSDGRILGRASQVWIAVDPKTLTFG